MIDELKIYSGKGVFTYLLGKGSTHHEGKGVASIKHHAPEDGYPNVYQVVFDDGSWIDWNINNVDGVYRHDKKEETTTEA
jgi:hypothetical protein